MPDWDEPRNARYWKEAVEYEMRRREHEEREKYESFAAEYQRLAHKMLPSQIVPATFGNMVTGSFGPIPTAATPPSKLPTAMLAGPIVAWRLWRVKSDGSLWSAAHNQVRWPDGEPLVADAKPASRNAHGVYAMKMREAVAMGEYNPAPGERLVRGQVALWGLVIEHKDGYRAEFAYPVTIECGAAPMPGFPRVAGVTSLAAKIRERYGCEVVG